ncbi:MAG: hypothetical protein CMN75_11410 [Spirochaeta sp.]|nr:hypothetical protein [Spirochaeta sp.]RPG06888.1 MAG: PEP-CTERM sorting domain-containing protein [Proteobacteria bacterium TMED72]
MRTIVRSTTLSLFLSLGLLVLGAASASAFATTMTSNYSNGTVLTTGDTVSVTVNFDSEGVAGISLLSVSVLFNDTIMSWDQGASTSPSYALYTSGGKGNQYLVPATTNLTLRTGTSDQILLDWQNTALPGGNRDAGSFDMATLVFSVTDTGSGLAAFTLSNSSPGNILQLSDGSNPANAVSGDFDVVTPEPTTALLVGLGLAGLGVAGRRRQ